VRRWGGGYYTRVCAPLAFFSHVCRADLHRSVCPNFPVSSKQIHFPRNLHPFPPRPPPPPPPPPTPLAPGPQPRLSIPPGPFFAIQKYQHDSFNRGNPSRVKAPTHTHTRARARTHTHGAAHRRRGVYTWKHEAMRSRS
jgi:hypothetical protein